MSDHDDPVDDVILAFLEYAEGVAPRPTLEHLADADRRRAEGLIAGLVAARGLDPDASRLSIEELLAGTPLAGLFPEVRAAPAGGVDLTTLARALSDVDDRAHVDIDAATDTVVYSYLDLRARFVLVATTTAAVTDVIRAAVEKVFDADPDTSRVGVVAAGTDELMTRVLSTDDVGSTITTPRGEAHLRLDAPLPLALAARRILEQSAPQWPPFDFDQARVDALDVATIAAEVARRVIERESSRSYRGDKRRAYKALVGHEHVFADLVARVSVPGAYLDVEAETTRMLQATT